MNRFKRYIRIFNIQLLGISISYSIGNPLWFIKEFKNIYQVNRSAKIEDAIATLKHWIKFEKIHKDQITKAEELIEIQETILKYIQDLECEVKELRKGVNRDAQSCKKYN